MLIGERISGKGGKGEGGVGTHRKEWGRKEGQKGERGAEEEVRRKGKER